MTPYLVMLSVPGVMALVGARRSAVAWLLMVLLYWLMVGFRFQVGMDWDNYLEHYLAANGKSLGAMFFRTEPGFQVLLWAGDNIGGGYALVNAVAGLVFCWGFFAVAKRCGEPFLAVVAATPLLVIAFAMSGTRQSIAMGIVFYLYSNWERRGSAGKILFIVLASLFHFSAIFILIFVALGRRPIVERVTGALASIGLLAALIYVFPENIENYSELYVSGERKVEAPGAIAQVGVLAAAALAFFIYRRPWRLKNGIHPLYENLAFIAIVTLPGVLISSVGVYRFALYLWPMAMYVVAGFPALIANPTRRALYRLTVLIAALLLLIGWLTWSNSGYAWLPYQTWLLQEDGVRLRR